MTNGAENHRNKDGNRQMPSAFKPVGWLTPKPLQAEGIAWLRSHKYGYLGGRAGRRQDLAVCPCCRCLP